MEEKPRQRLVPRVHTLIIHLMAIMSIELYCEENVEEFGILGVQMPLNARSNGELATLVKACKTKILRKMWAVGGSLMRY